MRDDGDDFFLAVVKVAQTGLATCENGAAGEGVDGVRAFVRVDGVEGGEVDGREAL